jgi:hypothetical protein
LHHFGVYVYLWWNGPGRPSRHIVRSST